MKFNPDIFINNLGAHILDKIIELSPSEQDLIMRHINTTNYSTSCDVGLVHTIKTYITSLIKSETEKAS